MADAHHPKPLTMAVFNEDLVLEILQHLWVLHNTTIDQEFRPEAFRRFFARYALISRVWTLPAQRFVYRSTSVLWDHQFHSFEKGVRNPSRGSTLRDSIRVLEISISHSRMGNPLNRLEKVLRYCPRLIELRLIIGPEVNTLFSRPSQEKRLRESLLALRPTLRALQLRIEAPWTKTQVMKQIPELIPYSTLDFLSIVSQNTDIKLPDLLRSEWDVRTVHGARTHWPMETNSQSIPMTSILYPDPESTTPLICPETIRFYSDSNWDHDFLKLFGPRLKRVLAQNEFSDARWTGECNNIVTACPNLQQLLVLHFVPSRQKQDFPTSFMYVLEPQDWHTSVPSTTDEEDKEEKEADSEEKIIPPAEEKIVDIGDYLATVSHLVTFRWDLTKSAREAHRRTTFRNGKIYDWRWPSEAFTGRESTQSEQELQSTYRWSWSNELLDNHGVYMVALRQPSTWVEDSE